VVEEGKPAPDIELESDAGETVRLSWLRGKPVVLYFYPKDNTSGCTTQACGIRDAWSEFERAGAVVLGVSPDGVASHVKFRTDFELPFNLLADPDHVAAEAYGVWQQKTRNGRTYMGIVRSTFVIGADGNVVKALSNVTPATHADDVLAILNAERLRAD
jgi:thioredoxin-dependent peroxiredoxin